MKVAQVITLFLPDFVGGATLACARVAQGLRARGHAVEVFCGRPHGDAAPHKLELIRSTEGEKRSQLKRLRDFQKRNDPESPAMLERLRTNIHQGIATAQ